MSNQELNAVGLQLSAANFVNQVPILLIEKPGRPRRDLALGRPHYRALRLLQVALLIHVFTTLPTQGDR